MKPSPMPWPCGTQQLRVHDLEIDLRYRRLSTPEQDAELPLRIFDLFLILLAEPHRLHSRSELFARAWPGVIVEDANLSHSIWLLRRALGGARKHWIRTVAKSGYVFEPPAAVEIVGASVETADVRLPQPVRGDTEPVAVAVELTSAATAAMPAVIATATALTAKPARTASLRGSRWLLAVAVLLGLVSVLWWQRPAPVQARPAPPAAAQILAVALVEVGEGSGAALWPQQLLNTWLAWKLESLPEVRLLAPAHLAASLREQGAQLVFLSVQPQDAGDTWLLRARWQAQGREQVRRREATTRELVAAIDSLSGEIVAQLLPARAAAAWPPLVLDAAVAPRYASGLQALQRRDWPQAVRELEQAVQQAPQFGLARLQLAQALAHLSRAEAAMAQTAAAIAVLQPLPADVAAALDALRLARDPRRAPEAAARYAALAARNPGKVDYVLEHVRLLLRANQPRQALAQLRLPHWDTQTLELRLARLLCLAEAQLALGDAQASAQHARDAERLAELAGQGWQSERGEALLLQARIDSFQRHQQADATLYERAALQFEQAGDDLQAQFARFMAQSLQPQMNLADLDARIALARQRGYPRLEVKMLRVAAYDRFRSGQLDEFRARLEQALATALAAGDLHEQYILELDLLNEDHMRGRWASVDRRLARLRSAGLQGDDAAWVAQFDAMVASNSGQPAQALAILDRAEAAQRNAAAVAGALAGPLPAATARLACMRAEPLLALGKREAARAAWVQCAASGHPYAQQHSRIGLTVVALLAGEGGDARERLRAELASIEAEPDGPDRWSSELMLAIALTRAGAADTAQHLYRHVLPLAQRSGYGWLAAVAATGLAETAAMQGDWPAVQRHLAVAREGEAATLWALRLRLDLVDAAARLAGHDKAAALALLRPLLERARAHDDVLSQLEILSLLPPDMELDACDRRCRDTLLQRTGLRGANWDWLRPAPPQRVIVASPP